METFREWKGKVESSRLPTGETEQEVLTFEDVMRPEEAAVHVLGCGEQGIVGKERDKARWAKWREEKKKAKKKAKEDAMETADGGEKAEEDQEEKVKEQPQVACDESCVLPPQWADRLAKLLGELRPFVGDYESAFWDLSNFEDCDECVEFPDPNFVWGSSYVVEGSEQDEVRLCLGGSEGCKDGIRLMLRVRPHSRLIEKLLRSVYAARRAMNKVIEIDGALLSGDLRLVEAAAAKAKKGGEKDDDGVELGALGPEMNEVELKEKYGELNEKFRERERDHPVYECYFCKRMLPRRQLSVLEDMDGVKRLRKKSQEELLSFLRKRLKRPDLNLVDEEVEELLPLRKCSVCWANVIHGKVGGPMLENGMELKELPPELADLNPYEEFLIKRVKPFYSLVNLSPYGGKGLPNHLKVKATKGNVAYLRLPTGQTTEHVAKTLPETNPGFRIYADVPKASGEIVWRNIVDLKKVVKALAWLKKNNPLYADVEIDEEALAKIDPNEFVVLVKKSGEGGMEGDANLEKEAPDSQVVGGPRPLPVDEELPHLLTQERGKDLGHVVSAGYSLTPVNSARVQAGHDLEAYLQEKVQGEPVGQQTKFLDLMSFPLLFPYGDGGQDWVRRQVVRPVDFYRYMLQRGDPRFRQCPMYLHAAHYYKLDRAISHGIYASTKTGSGIVGQTAGQLLGEMAKGSPKVENDLTTMLRAIKNTKEYWNEQAGNLRVMDEALGPATWFLTVSCAEYHWAELEVYLRKRYEADSVWAKKPRAELIAHDPVAVAEFFHRRWKAYFEEVILAKGGGPLGEVENYYWRLEYQARGAPHIHCKLWVKDAPILGEDGVTDEQVLEYIAKYVTAKEPSETENMDLRALVNCYQRHKCSGSCWRRKFSSGKWWTQCRYGFPQPVNDFYKLNGVADSVKSRRGRKGRKNLYEVPRSESERNINPYNPAILQAWRANMDIQYVGEASHVLTSYITGYMTKAEKGETEKIWESLSEDKSAPSALRSLALKNNQNREVGIYEIADDLLGHSLYGASQAVEWLGAGMPGTRKRKLLSKKELVELFAKNPLSTEVLAPNLVDNYYPQRHADLEACSLYEIASKWRYEKAKEGEEADEDNPNRLMCQDEKGFFVKRTKEVLLKTRYIPPTKEKSEEYFQLLLQCHVPYRREEELLREKQGDKKYEEAFEEWLKESTTLQEALEKRKKLDAARELREKLEKEADEEEEAEEAAERAQMEEAAEAMDLAGDVAKAPEGFRSKPDYKTEEGHKGRVAELNAKQREVYDQVTSVIRHQLEHDGEKCNCSAVPGPIRQFVSGGAGVGKSKLIETVTEAVEMLSQNAVLLGAPTGLAARNIDGRTLHDLFKLPVQKGQKGVWEYERLPKDTEKMMYVELGKSKLLVIDEISMVSNQMLAFVHQRLVDVKGTAPDVSFGGMNVLVLGDLLQLPPVTDSSEKGQGSCCFEAMTRQQWKKAFRGSVGVTDPHPLWADFGYSELTENMRQAGDREYADMLNEMRVGEVSEKTKEALEKRVVGGGNGPWEVAKLLKKLIAEGKRPVCLNPKVDAVTQINHAMLVQMGIPVVLLHAVDASRLRRKKQAVKQKKGAKSGLQGESEEEKFKELNEYVKENTEKKVNETGGLAQVLPLGVGARVMLTKNLAVSEGLYNGAMGTVVKLKRNVGEPDGVAAVEVQFDNVAKPVEIERISAKFKINPTIEVTREQFPLKICYAITVHKSQGLSLDCVVTALDSNVFAPGMAYVALSRARTLDGLHLTALKTDRIWAERKAVAEYNRLRKKYTDLEELEAGNVRQPKEKQKLLTRRVADGLPEIALASQRGKGKKAPTKKGQQKKIGEKRKTVESGKAAVVAKKTRQAISAPAQTGGGNFAGQFVPFWNGDNRCFVNALVQSLLGLSGVVDWALSSSEGGVQTAMRDLVQVSLEGAGQMVKRETAALRDLVSAASGQNFSDLRQQDSHEFCEKMFENSPELQELFGIWRWEKIKCRCGAAERDLGMTEVTEVQMLRSTEGTETWEMMMEKSMKEDRQAQCPTCRERYAWGEVTTEYMIPESCKHLMMVVSRFRHRWNDEDQQLEEVECKGAVTGFKTDNVVIGGKRWRLSAAVLHHGASVRRGHYWAYVDPRVEGHRWLEKNDGSCKSQSRFVSNLGNAKSGSVYLMFLSRYES